MMADILDSLIVRLDSAETAEDAVTIDYDPEMNTYGDDGEAVTSFYSGESIYLLVQLEPGFSISGLTKTSGGLTNLGLVTRTETVTDHFFPDDSEQSLKWLPISAVTVDSDHSQAGEQILTVEDKNITCNSPPSVLDYHYQFQAFSLRVDHPGDMNITEDETFPLGIYVEVTK